MSGARAPLSLPAALLALGVTCAAGASVATPPAAAGDAPTGPPAGQAATPARSPRVPWQRDLRWADAVAQATATGRPILIDFTAAWCGPCKLLDVMVFNEPRVIAALQDVVLLQVDFDAPGPDALPGRFGVTSLPTLAWCAPDGSEVDRLVGYVSSARFLEIVSDWRRGTGVEAGLARRLADRPEAPDLLLESAQRLRRAGREREAVVALRRLLNLAATTDTLVTAAARRELSELIDSPQP